MKKPNNIILLIGNGCFVFAFLWSLARFFIHLFGVTDGDSIVTFYVFNELIPTLSILLLMVPTVILLMCNLMNKSGKVLPIFVAVFNTVFLDMSIVMMALPAIYRYLLLSKLGLVDTTLGVVVRYLCGGSILLLAAYTLSVGGGILSLVDQSKKVEETL